jgi:SSS family transporter
MTISPIDLAIIAVYMAGCTILGARLGRSVSGLKGYFLGESNIPAWAVMISIVATETSTATFLSVPAIVFKPGGDFTYLQLAIGYLVGRVVVSILLLPAYFRGEIYTAYQVLNRRFGGATKTTASVLFLITRTLGDGLRLYLAAIVLQKMLEAMNVQAASDASLAVAVLGMGVATIIYTFLGGMRAVIWTDVIQFFVYLVGAVVALFLIVGKVPGGWSGLWEAGVEAHKFRLFDFHFDVTQPYTFWSGLFGGLFLCTATHGADQLMVQRYLSARSQKQAAAALISSGVVVLLQFALFLTIGAGLFVLDDTAGGPRPAPDRAFIDFIVHNMRTGLLGLVLAAIFSAAMSTLSSSLNASASATINDLYRPLAPNVPEERLLRLSKVFTIAWGLAQMGVALLAIRLNNKTVVESVLEIASFTTGIVLGLFLLGILTRTVAQRDALLGLLIGLAVNSYVKFGPWLNAPKATPSELSPLYPFQGAIAWPWYALIGSSTVFLTGLLSSRLRRAPAPNPRETAQP